LFCQRLYFSFGLIIIITIIIILVIIIIITLHYSDNVFKEKLQ